MLEYLTDAVAHGRSDEVSQICDCLYLVVPAAAANMNAEESHDAR